MDSFSNLLFGMAVLALAASVGLLGHGLYQGCLRHLIADVRARSPGGARGAASVLVRRLGMLNRQLMWPRYEAWVRRNLVKGGEPQGYRPEDILALQELSAVLGVLVGLFLVNGAGLGLGWSVPFLLLGAYYPLLWVGDQVRRRHLLIGRALPYGLDLLTLAVEAGLDFTGALAKVAEKGRAGPLGDELRLLLKQLKMGKTREEALRALALRVDLPALSTFVTALIQADRMGTGLGRVLRIQATQLRLDRSLRAEKLAGEAPVKMLFPLIVCIFPTVFMVLFGPIVFQVFFGKGG